MALVEIAGLTYAYGDAPETPVLTDCSLSIEPGEMVLVVGPSGCGKSTLLRAMNGLVPRFYGGRLSGTVRLAGRDVRDATPAQLADTAACVFQDPEAQLVASSVREEVAFGLENLGVAPDSIPLRIAEALGALGISHLAERSTRELSGGEMQRVALASAIAMRPALLLLDEPTSQLDPTSAESLLELLRRINEEYGITVVLAEHRLDRCYHWADRVVVMEAGRIVSDATPRESAAACLAVGSAFVPPVTRLFEGAALPELPLTVKEGRAALRQIVGDRALVCPDAPAAPAARGLRSGSSLGALTPSASTPAAESSLRPPAASAAAVPAASLRDIRFSYADGREVLRGCSLTIGEGEFVALMGENGAGKSTLVRHLNGLARPDSGSVALFGADVSRTATEELARTCALLGQNPNDFLVCDTVAEELAFSLEHLRPELDAPAREAAIAGTLARLGIESLASAEPRALSAGQRQRVAIAAMLVAGPELLVLDEPTRGLDWASKAALGELLRELLASGTTLLVVTHDIEFAAAFADRVAVMGSGLMLADGPTREVLSATSFLSPQVSRVLGAACGAITVEDGRAVLAATLGEAVLRG